MTLVYNPESPHVCRPPKNNPRDWSRGAIWKCECGDLFMLRFRSTDLNYAYWERLYRIWSPLTYWRYRNK